MGRPRGSVCVRHYIVAVLRDLPTRRRFGSFDCIDGGLTSRFGRGRGGGCDSCGSSLSPLGLGSYAHKETIAWQPSAPPRGSRRRDNLRFEWSRRRALRTVATPAFAADLSFRRLPRRQFEEQALRVRPRLQSRTTPRLMR
jgi:hypothetical protein